MFNFEDFAGPAGGALAVAFATGAAAGWGFAEKTVMRWAKKEIKALGDLTKKQELDCHDKILELKRFFDMLDEQYKERISKLEKRLSHLES